MFKDKWKREKYEWRISNFTRENVVKRMLSDEDWDDDKDEVYQQKIVKSDLKYEFYYFKLEFYDDKMAFNASDRLLDHSALKVALQTTDNKLDYCFDIKWKWHLKIDDIFNNSSKYLKEDTLTLVIHTEFPYFHIYCDESYGYDRGYKAALSDSCGKFFNSEDFGDVKIVCNDGVELPAHQCILASRSPVFYAMLSRDMLEKKTQRIEIDDIDGETMLEVLRFIYTDKVQKLHNLASNLIYAAEKYDLEKLKSTCGWKLVERMSADRALKYLMIADCVNEPFLLEESLSCINANVAELEETDEWKAIDCALMAKITAYIEEKAADVIKFTNSL